MCMLQHAHQHMYVYIRIFHQEIYLSPTTLNQSQKAKIINCGNIRITHKVQKSFRIHVEVTMKTLLF